jgi:tRNA (adenine22-N1)-methyltransferase
MGGDTICGILDRAEWLSSGRYRLILQPMTKPEVVRYWLIHNEFSIDLEAVAREDQHVYQIFRAVPGHSKSMSDAEYLIGSGSVPRRGDKICFVIDQQLRTITKKLNGYPTQKAAESPEYAFYLNMKRELEELKASIQSKEFGNG